MSEKIDETLKKLAEDTLKANSPITSNTKANLIDFELPGDPECPHCAGQGYLREDFPVGHPDFGKLTICICRNNEISQQVRQKLFKLSQLEELRHLTFENFNPRGRIGLPPPQADSLEQAYNHARLFAQSLDGWLLLQGKFGSGKTHLAASIANYAVSMGVPTLFITVPDLLDTLRFTYDNPDTTFEERFEEIRTANLLILDDFGTQNATAWSQEKLFQILNYRYINRLPMVVTMNLTLEELEGRIRSRLMDPELVSRVYIVAPDYRNPTIESDDSDMSSLYLHRGQTFSSFDDRLGEGLSPDEVQSIDKALKGAQEFAIKREGWYILIGEHSTGKTHLAAAIGHECYDLGNSLVFISVTEFLDHLRATFNPNSTIKYDQRFNEAKTAKLLILDGLGTQSMTPWVREKIFQLFDYRYNAKLAMVITMNLSLEELYDIEPGIASRMLDTQFCKRFAITAPAYRGNAQEG